MKTSDQAFTEWACDEILFDYMHDGVGPTAHTRAQYTSIWSIFRTNPRPESNLFNGGNDVHLEVLGGRRVTQRWLSGIMQGLTVYRNQCHGRLMVEDIDAEVSAFFDIKRMLLYENAQEVINALIAKARVPS